MGHVPGSGQGSELALDTQALLEALEGVALILDPQLRIRAVGWRAWDDLYRQAGGQSPPHCDVIGRVVTEFMTPGPVRETYGRLFDDVAHRRRRRVKVDFRCDAPDTERQMRLAVAPVLETGTVVGLLYQSVLLHARQRPPLPLFAAEAAAEGQVGVLTICTVCARVAWPIGTAGPDREWIEAAEYYRRGGAEVALLSHGFCPPCYERLTREEQEAA
ncbi:hypothetical protein ACE7GA_12535 [Roseomonas sp. CCTCC AB2023176]|uniref:hypothetical protein n=1 Tax=Roseomonas sp. CCTCC AB2023176 TaxID=3342640 RepID=UPI0035DF62B6